MKQRNFVARAKQSGAGKHKDKRKQLKHKELHDDNTGESREEARDERGEGEALGARGGELVDG